MKKFIITLLLICLGLSFIAMAGVAKQLKFAFMPGIQTVLQLHLLPNLKD